MSQRAVAKATRIKYGLQTFSHSTVCRSFKVLEYAVAYCRQEFALQRNVGDFNVTSNIYNLSLIYPSPKHNTQDKNCNDIAVSIKPNKSRCFPAVTDTARRRRAMFKFVPKLSHNLNLIDIEVACCRFAEKWHEKSWRLLL
jgi:hypothetical protein